MFLRVTLLGILLLSVLGTETALAGSSFLSPAYKNLQQQKDTRKPTARLHPRGTGSLWDTDGTEGGGDGNSAGMEFNVPFEIGVKITEREYQEYGQALEKMLQDILEENDKETQTKN